MCARISANQMVRLHPSHGTRRRPPGHLSLAGRQCHYFAAPVRPQCFAEFFTAIAFLLAAIAFFCSAIAFFFTEIIFIYAAILFMFIAIAFM